MRITLELEPADIARFLCALERSHRLAREAEETDVIDAAKYALNSLPIGNAPSLCAQAHRGGAAFDSDARG